MTQPNNRTFYRVSKDIASAPLRDFLWHGYETRHDFEKALRKLVGRWGGRVGEAIAERSHFLRLRFHDTLGGRPDEAWLPRYLLVKAPIPEYLNPPPVDPVEEELDRIFGFD